MKENICFFIESKYLWIILYCIFAGLVLTKAHQELIAFSILLITICMGILSFCRIIGYGNTNLGIGFNLLSLIGSIVGIIIIGTFILTH